MKVKRNWILFLENPNPPYQDIVYRFKTEKEAEHCAGVYRGWGWNAVVQQSRPITRGKHRVQGRLELEAQSAPPGQADPGHQT